MGNVDPKKNPITTIAGACFIALGLFMYALPMFFELKKDFSETWYVPLIVISVGILLLFSADSVAQVLLGGLKKKVDNDEKSNG